jgi:apolipoprotein N-acyltransferase
MTSVAAPDPDTHSAATADLGARSARRRLAAGVASGLLLWLAFPPVGWGWLAWGALTPLFWLVTRQGAPLTTYLAAWAGGFVFWVLAVEWIRLTDPGAWVGWIVLALVFSLWWPLFVLLTRWAVFRLRLPLVLAAPIVWVAIEYVRAYFLTGFPWYYLAHSQFRYLDVIQIADFASSLGVSLLIAMVNAWLVDLATLPLLGTSRGRVRLTRAQTFRLWVVGVLVGMTLCYGAIRRSSARFRDGPRLALLQSNLPQYHKVKKEASETVLKFQRLIERALAHRQRPDLIIWPETAYPYGFITLAPAIDPAALKRQIESIAASITVPDWLKKRADIVEHLHSWTDQVGVPMLVGTLFYDHGPAALSRYNSAILLEPNLRVIHSYHKMHLVPFGEFIPFVQQVPWLALLTPYRGDRIPSLSFGRQALTLPLGSHRLAVTICFEDTIPQVIGRFFGAAAAERKPDILINLSNDGWFHGSSELDMHLAIGVFRAVEHRVPLARAVNTGLSALVDGNGEIRATLPKETEDVLSVTVPLDDRTTYYSRWGDWLGLSCLAVTIGLIPLGLVRKPIPQSALLA